MADQDMSNNTFGAGPLPLPLAYLWVWVITLCETSPRDLISSSAHGLQPWGRKDYFPPKRWYPLMWPHNVKNPDQKLWIVSILWAVNG